MYFIGKEKETKNVGNKTVILLQERWAFSREKIPIKVAKM